MRWCVNSIRRGGQTLRPGVALGGRTVAVHRLGMKANGRLRKAEILAGLLRVTLRLSTTFYNVIGYGRLPTPDGWMRYFSFKINNLHSVRQIGELAQTVRARHS